MGDHRGQSPRRRRTPSDPTDGPSPAEELKLPYGPIERWMMESNYPIEHDYFYANPDVDAFVVAKLTGLPPALPAQALADDAASALGSGGP